MRVWVMCVLACVLHAGDRFRCWKRILCGMEIFGNNDLSHCGFGFARRFCWIFSSFFSLSFSSREESLSPAGSPRLGECVGYKVSVQSTRGNSSGRRREVR